MQETVTTKTRKADFLRPTQEWAPTATDLEKIDTLFPAIDPQHTPFADRIILQLRSPVEKSKGGIILTEDSRDTQKWNEQVARVIAIGPIAFHFQKDMTPWPDGRWFEVGDFVRVPMYGSERWETIDGERKAIFVIRRAHEVIARVHGNPLEIKTYV